MSYDPNDPQWTAFALGELDEEQAQAFEAQLEGDEQALAEVAALQDFAALLSQELAAEQSQDSPELTQAQLEGLEAFMEGAQETAQGFAGEPLSETEASEVAETATEGTPDNVIRPSWGRRAAPWAVVASAAAAVMLFFNVYKDPAPAPPLLPEPGDIDGRFTVIVDPNAVQEENRKEGLVVTTDPAGAQIILGVPSSGDARATNQPVQPSTTVASPDKASIERLKTLGYLDSNTDNAQSAAGPVIIAKPIMPVEGVTGGLKKGGYLSQNGVTQKTADRISGLGRVPATKSANKVITGASADQHNLDSIIANGEVAVDGGLIAPNTVNDATGVHHDLLKDNPFEVVRDAPLSTFSIDVDTASYSAVRRYLNRNQLPPADSVRVEELINYFDYAYEPPSDGDAPFKADVAVTACPWKPAHRLVRVALKGRQVAARKRPASNLVFLLDVSGSMGSGDKLPLLKQSMGMMLASLNERDRVAIVVYAGASGLVLPSTPASDQTRILGALDRLEAGGSTNGGAGIELAYSVAARHFIPGGVNRVILATDGDFNVGTTSRGELVRMVERKAKANIFLTVLGFGMDNLRDGTLEQISNQGNGQYAYIDTLSEARKVMVEQLSGTLVTIAKDVKIQIEFNPAVVSGYRLIGYANRMLAARDFNDDRKDAGEIGAGHTVTALYEVIPNGQPVPSAAGVDPLKYQPPALYNGPVNGSEMLTLKLRYKTPEGSTSKLLEYPVANRVTDLQEASGDLKFAASVAAFGMLLRRSPHAGGASFEQVLRLANEGRDARDPHGYRAEFIKLVRTASKLMR